MVYLDGDNALEQAALDDFAEMATVGSGTDFNIVVQLDRHPDHSTNFGDWTGTRRGRVEPGDTPTASWGTSVGEVNMGDATSLNGFVQWAQTTYPANDYALILWDNGTGFVDCCEDDTDSDSLTMPEISTALGTIFTLDLLGFDACLMGMAEVAYQFRSEADVLVASEEIEPGDGWEYQNIFDKILADPGMNAETLAGHILDAYEAAYNGAGIYTLSSIDLDEMGSPSAGLAGALADFAELALTTATSADWTALRGARDAAQGFNSDRYRDLGDFMTQVEGAVVATAIIDAATDVKDALDDAVIEAYAGASVTGTGLSIYLPQDDASAYDLPYDDLLFADIPWNHFADHLASGELDIDAYESNDTISTATVLGSLPKITLRDLTIDNADDADYFQITAQDTGKLVINVFFEDALGNLDIRIEDADGNYITGSYSTTDDEHRVIPVVSQEQYFLRVQGWSGDTNVYDVEIENFAAPVPGAVVLDPADDTGASNSDNVTSEDEARIIIEADLYDFAAEGIDILTSTEAAAGDDGAAVDVYVNGVWVGYADVISGTFDKLFEFTFGGTDLSTTFIPVGGGGGLNFVQASVRIFDGQDTQQNGRTQLSEPLLLILDQTAPAPGTPDLLPSSDSGTSGSDNITNVTQPAFYGLAEPNSTVLVLANNLLVGQGVVGTDATGGTIDDGLGFWEVTVEPLKHGQYNITSRMEDLAGNLSDPSNPLQITIDTTPPQRPTIDLINADDTGRSDMDNVTIGDPDVLPQTQIADFRISAELNTTVAIKDGELIVDTFTFDAAFDNTDGVAGDGFGIQRIDFDANETTYKIPAEGPHPLTVESIDDADNFTQSEQLLVEIDTTAPAASSTPDLLETSDSGSSNSDNITAIDQPAFGGTAEANSLIRIYANTVLVGEGVVGSDESDGSPNDGLGIWEVTVEPLVDGTYVIQTRVEDLAGNRSALSDSLEIMIDATLPQRPTIDLINADDTGSSDLDNVTIGDPDVLPQTQIADFRISAELDTTVVIKDGEVVIDTFVADLAFDATNGGPSDLFGIRRIDFAVNETNFGIPAEGPHPLTVESTDAAGNFTQSEQLLVEIDTTAPLASSTPDLLATSDSGISDSDNITDIKEPAFAGTAEANSLIRIYADGILVGEGVVGSDETDGVPDDGLGRWEVTVEPLDYGIYYSITTILEDLAGNLSQESDPLTVVIDPFEPNDAIETATVLGSEQKITLRDVLLHDGDDEDFFQITAQDTGKLIINAFFEDAHGDIDIEVQDALGNFIEGSYSFNDDEQVIIPVVSQEQYFLWVDLFDDPDGDGNYYDLEIENFAAPLVDNVDLPAKDQSDVLNDTGLSQFDDVTSRTEPEIILEADLFNFTENGMTIDILDSAQAAAGNVPGAAVEVFVNGDSVGFADLIPGTDSTLFRYTFTPGQLPETAFVADSGGWLHYVKGAVRIFDGQTPTISGRTQLSEPLQLVVDTSGPAASVPDMLDSSDSGRYNNDDVTNITTPAFGGTAEHNAIVRIFAVDVTDPANPGPAELVGQGCVGTDLTDDGFDQVGSWEVTVEPLDAHSNEPGDLYHYASYEIIVEVEDLAGNITRFEEDPLQIWIDTTPPNTPYLDLVDASDTGRHNYDNITFDNQPTVTITADDTPLGNGNPFPNTLIYRIYDRPDPDGLGGGANNGEVLLVDSFITNPNFTDDGFFTEVLSTLADGVSSYTLLDGVHNLKLEVEDLAGNMSEDFLLEVTVDTVAPPVSIIDIDPAATDTGIEDQPDTFVDRITSDTATGFVGWAEANTIVRLYVDPSTNGNIGYPAEYSLTVAVPEDGNLAFPNGQWRTAFIHDLNHPDFFPLDGLREVLVTAEDVAGNVNTINDGLGDENQILDIFIDTRGPQVDDVLIVGHEEYDLFDPKPTEDGPTPLVYSLDIDFIDQPTRVDGNGGSYFVYPAVNEILATTAGNYQLVGDANGVIPIASIEFLDETMAGSLGCTTIRLNFFEPLPDDRFTLTVSDRIKDDAGNALDGETDTVEPQEIPQFPSGDGEPGEDFTARFTVDSRPEIGVWAAGSVWVDTNGNFVFDPYNPDYVNRDITYVLAFTSDEVFAGNFAAGAGETADGFDKLAVYGRVGNQWRWLIDFNNDGVPDLDINDPANVNGMPVAGRFDDSDTNGDEVGLYTGNTWYFDTDHDFQVDMSLRSNSVGYPIVGDFDGDGYDDLGTWADGRFSFDLTGGVRRGWDGQVDVGATIDFGFIGVRERPVAADMNQDGIDDIGLWVPDRAGVLPEEVGEWYFLISDAYQVDSYMGGSVAALDHPFTPVPFGNDLYAKFGDEFALPVVGNFDPPIAGGQDDPPEANTSYLSTTLVRTPTATDAGGKVDTLPESEESIDEWSTHWVEIWIETKDTNDVGVASATVDLAYNTNCFTPTAIEYGPAFTENQAATIDDGAGVIDDLTAGTSTADVGLEPYVLLARVRFDSTEADTGLPLTADTLTTPSPADVGLRNAEVTLLGNIRDTVVLTEPPATTLSPVVFDLDDDGEVGLGDLSYFAGAYGHAAAAQGVAYAWACDFDRDGQIGLGDLSYFAAAYGRVHTDPELMLCAGGSLGGSLEGLAPPPAAGLTGSYSAAATAAAHDAALAAEYGTSGSQMTISYAYTPMVWLPDDPQDDEADDEAELIDLLLSDPEA